MRPGLLFCLLPLACVAQSGSPTEDLCSIEGQIFDAASGAPLSKATLIVRRTDVTSAKPNSPFNVYSTTSDAAGKFAMKDIEPGKYRLTASRTGFATVEYGAPRPGR